MKVTQDEQIRNRVLEIIRTNKNQRQTPNEVIQSLSAELEVSISLVRVALNALVKERKLVITYRGPYTYLEIPCKELADGSRPMKVIIDDKGNPWICNCDVDPSDDLAAQGCWQIRDDPDGLGR